MLPVLNGLPKKQNASYSLFFLGCRSLPLLWIVPAGVVMSLAAPIGFGDVNLPIRGSSGEITLGLGSLEDAAYSPDGRHIATCGSRGAFLWDVETGDLMQTLLGHRDGVRSVAFSPDGGRVLTGSEDQTAKLWDVKTGNLIRTFRGHADHVYSVAFSPDGTRVLTATRPDRGDDPSAVTYDIRIWDISDLAVRSGIGGEEWALY